MVGKFPNGYDCPAGDGWATHNKKIDELTDDIWKINLGVGQMQQLLGHMDQLPVIANALTEIKDKTLNVAIGGKDASLMKMFMAVVSILSLVIVALVFVIGSLLVGEKFGLIKDLIR